MLSITAVALSVSLLIVVASLFAGFINAFEQAAVQAMGDVVLTPPMKFTKYPLFIEQLERLDAVEAATATISAQGLLHLGQGNVRAVEIRGIEPASREKVTGFKRSLLRQKDSPGEPSFKINGSAEQTSGFVGIAVVISPDEQTDEYDIDAAKKMFDQRVFLTTGAVTEEQDAEGTIQLSSLKRKFIPFLIADISFTGVYDLDKRFIYLPIEKLQQTLYPDEDSPIASQIHIKLSPGTSADAAITQISSMWQSFVDEQLNGDIYLSRFTDIETAKQMQSRYVAAYRKQMGLLLLIFGVVSFGVILLIFCIFYMIVRLKQKDIAIIKSCGTTSRSVALIFMGFGACVGTVGSGIGAILGYIFTKNVNMIEQWISIIFGLKLWKSSVYMFSKIPNEVDWGSALPIILLAMLAAIIGALIPAIVAARVRPVEILRYE